MTVTSLRKADVYSCTMMTVSSRQPSSPFFLIAPIGRFWRLQVVGKSFGHLKLALQKTNDRETLNVEADPSQYSIEELI
jgi:hypothetical protein